MPRHPPVRRTGLLALALSVVLGAMAAHAGARTTVDAPDQSSDPQIHAIYALPSDGVDRELDDNGTIAREIGSFQRWLSGQAGGRALRIDTAGGSPDVTFFRLAKTDAEVAARGAYVRDEIEAELHAAGFNAPNKIYAVWYDGGSTYACGGGAYPPSLPGNVAAMYLHGTPPGAPPCDSNPFAASADSPPGYLQLSMLHELLHTMGLVAACAPHEVRAGHVSDSPEDLMYAGDEAWRPTYLDVNHDDYYAANIPGCLDLATSGWLTAAASGPGGGADTDPPETTITKGPKKKVELDKGETKVKVAFKFASDEAGSTFACKLDKAPERACTSPFKARVKEGKHAFQVEATDPVGNADPAPAKRKFEVVA